MVLPQLKICRIMSPRIWDVIRWRSCGTRKSTKISRRHSDSRSKATIRGLSFFDGAEPELHQKSHLEQLILIQQNAHKHVLEINELANNHYTNALKIKQTDSWVWNKIGMIEYQQFANLDMARQCFEAAINTRATLQKRSAILCTTLVKFAEIYFKLSDFQKSEELVVSILTRESHPTSTRTLSFSPFR